MRNGFLALSALVTGAGLAAAQNPYTAAGWPPAAVPYPGHVTHAQPYAPYGPPANYPAAPRAYPTYLALPGYGVGVPSPRFDPMAPAYPTTPAPTFSSAGPETAVPGDGGIISDGDAAPSIGADGVTFPHPSSSLHGPAVVSLGHDGNPHAHKGGHRHCWLSLEYLYWQIKDGPLPGPLVTTGDPTDPNAGAIGRPSTVPLFGTDGLDYGQRPGFRGTLGGWCDDHGCWGLEVTGFALGRGNARFTTASGPDGSPALYLPYFDPSFREDAAIIADPVRQFSGTVVVDSTSDLWGVELNGLRNLQRKDGCTTDLLYGFRFLGLDEDFLFSNTSTDLLDGTITAFNDRFNTKNRFYGGQLGLRHGYRHGHFGIDLLGKLAVGATHQTSTIEGQTAISGTVPLVSAGGFLAQPTNIGTQNRDVISLVPEVQVKGSWYICDSVRVFAGYNALYWSRVARPGSQIDRALNLTQSVEFGGGTLVGPALPAPRLVSSDFWAHGFNVGVEFTY